MTSYYNIFQGKQIPRQIFYQEKTKSIPRKIIRMCKYSKENFGHNNR